MQKKIFFRIKILLSTDDDYYFPQIKNKFSTNDEDNFKIKHLKAFTVIFNKSSTIFAYINVFPFILFTRKSISPLSFY